MNFIVMRAYYFFAVGAKEKALKTQNLFIIRIRKMLIYKVFTLFKSSNAFFKRSTNVFSPSRNQTRGS